MSELVPLDETDLTWIASAVDAVERSVGRPWRDGFGELERAYGRAELVRPAGQVTPGRAAAVTSALLRLAGGRARYAASARRARALVLGAPVFSTADRTERVRTAAAALGVPEPEIERLLWADLPAERAIELPYGRPSELEVAATANVQLVQRALRRAQTARLRMWGDDGSVLRAAVARGLLATASRGHTGETVLEIVGPLALFHRTSVYARTLGQLVPLLAACDRFELELLCETGTETYTTTVASPVLLPLAPFERASWLARRLAKDLARLAPELAVTLGPPPLAAGAQLACPDLALGGGRFVEIVGFWTADYLARKLARYRDAGAARVVLCVDEARDVATENLPEEAIGYVRRVDAERVLEALAC